MLHSLPSEWPASTLNGWLDLINMTEGLAFNPEVVPGDIIMKSLDTKPK
jgi:hypothetical protein